MSESELQKGLQHSRAQQALIEETSFTFVCEIENLVGDENMSWCISSQGPQALTLTTRVTQAIST